MAQSTEIAAQDDATKSQLVEASVEEDLLWLSQVETTQTRPASWQGL